jgi:cation:H+ antiporter
MGLIEIIGSYGIVFHIVIIALTFIILVKSSNMVVLGIDRYAKKEGLSDYLIGLLVVSFTASTPELVSSINGIISGDTGIVFGTILGSNITGITLVLGIFALVGRKVKLENKILTNLEVLLFFLMSIPFLLAADGILSRIDGAILIIIYFVYVIFLWKKEYEIGKIKNDVKLSKVWKDVLLFMLAIAAMFLSSQLMVNSTIFISKSIGISSFVMAVLVIGIASSLPDMFVGLKALFSKDVGIGIGDLLGSIIVKLLLFFGIFCMIKPLEIKLSFIVVSMIFMIFSLAFVMYLSERKEMDWRHGIFLIFTYIAYIIVEILRSGGA